MNFFTWNNIKTTTISNIIAILIIVNKLIFHEILYLLNFCQEKKPGLYLKFPVVKKKL